MSNEHAQRPPDRSALSTELRNPRSMSLHQMSARQIVDLIRDEDRAVLSAMDRAADSITRLIEAAVGRFERGGRLIYLGAGTSGRLGVLDASEAPPTFQITPDRVVGIIAGGDSALRRSSEGSEDDPDGAAPAIQSLRLASDDTVIGIAAGGTTPYVLGALRLAKRVAPDCVTALIACVAIPAPPAVDHLIHLDTGPEVVTGSTRMKAGTATKLALNTISTTLMVLTGRVHENLMVDLKATNEKLKDRAARIVATLTGLDRESSFALLDQAGGSVKTAVVMFKLRMLRPDAERLLVQAGGRLHQALQSPPVQP
jgi:N-acetylmuramic acid 6-phosphate etherase